MAKSHFSSCAPVRGSKEKRVWRTDALLKNEQKELFGH
jgi:hypothetical protein